jgi:hypothetical protein
MWINGFQWRDLDWKDIDWDQAGIDINALTNNQTDTTTVHEAFLSLLQPHWFSADVVGDANFLHPSILGPAGVDRHLLDNRHIHTSLKEFLCLDETDFFRDYFGALVDFAWPDTARLLVCCLEDAGKETSNACDRPSYVFGSRAEEVNNQQVPPLTIAPHFLTSDFDETQQEMLTAAFIAMLNVKGAHVAMELTGIWDLGPAGTRFAPRQNSGVYKHELGAAWGNMFLDCNDRDRDHHMCKDSYDGIVLGRDPIYRGVPMFTCSGDQNDGLFPLHEWGKSCFSQGMDTASAHGCGFVVAVGACNVVCLLGHCGFSRPPREDRVTTNVIQVYLSDFDWEQEQEVNQNSPTQISPTQEPHQKPDNGSMEPETTDFSYLGAISVVVLGLFICFGFLFEKKCHRPTPKPAKNDNPEESSSTGSDKSIILQGLANRGETESARSSVDIFSFRPTPVKDIMQSNK